MLAATQNPTLSLVLADETATQRLASALGALLEPGDVVTLSGDLGAGKTTLARSIIRYLARDENLEVPSPTFTLLQVYDLPRFPVVHADFYRLSNPAETAELGFAEAADGAVVLVEWPDRAEGFLPPDHIAITLTLAPELGTDCRHVLITGFGSCRARAGRFVVIHHFLEEAGFGTAERTHVQGDASTRAYERLAFGKRHAILMNAPRRPDGPPVKDGLPYSAIAHLAEDVKPFVAMSRGLRERGFSAPAVYAADMAEGLLILEDLGSEAVVAGDPPTPIEERYAAAVDLLVALHRRYQPTTLPLAPAVEYKLPAYDLPAYHIELELLLDWYLPHRGTAVDAAGRERFTELWNAVLQRPLTAEVTWVLRDYHSPNLLWLPEREGIARVGVLDFQDAMMGPPAYDLVSLTQDARIDVPESLEEGLLARYMKARRAADRSFDFGNFFETYAVLGAQRATKVLGIFSRLDRRDGKPQYLRHRPRVWRALRRSLAHPALRELKAWYDANVPPPPPNLG
jgi:tRNA threonylcarbamoyl adenosine modification protein YjeE